jgi:hypothetical protein
VKKIFLNKKIFKIMSLEKENTETGRIETKEEILEFLTNICESIPNDQVLGFKIRKILDGMKKGVLVYPEKINFVS